MSDQPNILVFLTDDHGQWAANCYGTTALYTPNMNRLADTGARMDRAFTPCAVCSPARACFLTGRFPSQHGVHDWLHDHMEDSLGREHPGISGQTNVAQLLQRAGYTTAMIGKWHAGRDDLPHAGFDRWFGFERGQYPHQGEMHFSDQGADVVHHGFQSTLITDAALDFLRGHQTVSGTHRPWFMQVGYVDTHSPFKLHAERLVDRYRAHTFDELPREATNPLYTDRPQRIVPDDPTTLHEWNAQYYAAVQTIDEQIGRLLDHLEATGELENTLIVYTSDHGHMNGHHNFFCKGNASTPQNFFDESILVPCLLSWPAAVRAGQVREEMVDHCDLFATVLDAAGAEVDEATASEINSPGRSYLPMLRGEAAADWRVAQICEYGNARMIRTDRYKLIRRWPGKHFTAPDEFYDLQADPRETTSVIDDPQHADTIADLSRQLDAFFERREIAERSGLRAVDGPVHNGVQEPWLREIE